MPNNHDEPSSHGFHQYRTATLGKLTMNTLTSSRRKSFNTSAWNLPLSAAIIFSAASFSDVAAAAGCFPLNLPTPLELVAGDITFAAYSAATPPIGGAGLDTFDAFFFEEAIGIVGSFELGSGVNANFSTCTYCLTQCVNRAGDSCEKSFFVDQGVLTLQTAPGEENLQLQVSNWRFSEVTIDPNTSVSTPVPGGDCYSSAGARIFANGFESP